MVSILNVVSIFEEITPETWQRSSGKIQFLSWFISTLQLVRNQRHQVSSKQFKVVQKYLLQFNMLAIKEGMLH